MTREKDRKKNVERKRWNEGMRYRGRVTIRFIYTIQQ